MIDKIKKNMNVGLLTLEQKNKLVNQLFASDSYFNPVQDFDLNWVISIQEIGYCVISDFMWVKDLPLITWNPPIPPPPIF